MAKPRIIHEEHIKKARELLASGMGICDVGRALNLNRRTLATYIERPKRKYDNLWKPDEISLAKRLRNEGHTYSVIAKQIGRTAGAVERKLFRPGRSPEAWRSAFHNPPIPEHVAAERERAYSAELPIGADLMGDPRPGRSALDQRGG